MASHSVPYDARRVEKALRAWGFMPDPSRNVGGHLAYRLGEDGPVVGVPLAGKGSKDGITYKAIRKAVRHCGASSIHEFIAGPPTHTISKEENMHDTQLDTITDTPTPKARTYRKGFKDDVLAAIGALNAEGVPANRKAIDDLVGPGGNLQATINNLRDAKVILSDGKGNYTLPPKEDDSLKPEEVVKSHPRGGTIADAMKRDGLTRIPVEPDRDGYTHTETMEEPHMNDPWEDLPAEAAWPQEHEKAQAEPEPKPEPQMAKDTERLGDDYAVLLSWFADNFHLVGFDMSGEPVVQNLNTHRIGNLGLSFE